MSTIQQLVANLGTGFKLVGDGTPIEQTAVTQIPNPDVPGTTQTVNRGTGNYFVIVQDPDGVQRQLLLKADPNSQVLQGQSVHQTGADAGPLKVKQSGINDQTDADKANLYNGDLSKLDWSQSGPLQDVPNKPNKPSATLNLDRLDSSGNVIPKSDTSTKAVQLRDPSTGTVTDVPKDAAGSLTTLNNTPYVIKPDGTATPVTGPDGKAITVTKDKQQINVPGIGLVEYDPSKTGVDAYTTIIKTPTGVQAKDLQPQKVNGKTYIAVDDGNGGIHWQQTDLPDNHIYTVAAGGNDPRSSKITLVDENGNSTSIDKAGWTPPPNAQSGSAITPDTTSPFVVTIGDNGQPVFTANQNRVSITDAQKQLIQQLGGKVADGTMSEKEAQDLITSTTQAMTAQASQQNAQANLLTAQTNQQRLGQDAATNAISGVNQAAQVGQGLLQNRVTAATGALNNAVSAIGGSKMMNAPAGMGANLVNGLSEWVTQLGGGQPVYDAAAAMVNAANPTVSGDPSVAQQAYATLRGAMDLYKQQTGTDYQPPAQRNFTSPTTTSSTATVANPAANNIADGTPLSNVTPNAAATAANQTNNQGFNPQASTAALNQRGLLDNPAGRALAAGQPATTGAPVAYPGQFNPVFQQATPSAVGTVASGPVIGAPAPAPSPYIPMWGPQSFTAPTTMAA